MVGTISTWYFSFSSLAYPSTRLALDSISGLPPLNAATIFGAGDVIGRFGVVQHLGKGGDVRSVGADDSETEVGGGGHNGTQ